MGEAAPFFNWGNAGGSQYWMPTISGQSSQQPGPAQPAPTGSMGNASPPATPTPAPSSQPPSPQQWLANPFLSSMAAYAAPVAAAAEGNPGSSDNFLALMGL